MIFEFISNVLFFFVAFLNVFDVKLERWNRRLKIGLFFAQLPKSVFFLNDQINLWD